MEKEIEVLEKIRDYCRNRVDCKQCKYGNIFKHGCAVGCPILWKLEIIKKEAEKNLFSDQVGNLTLRGLHKLAEFDVQLFQVLEAGHIFILAKPADPD